MFAKGEILPELPLLAILVRVAEVLLMPISMHIAIFVSFAIHDLFVELFIFFIVKVIL